MPCTAGTLPTAPPEAAEPAERYPAGVTRRHSRQGQRRTVIPRFARCNDPSPDEPQGQA